jgi:GeoRSP system PqqD family protein
MSDGPKFHRSSEVAHRVIGGQAVVVVPATQAMHTLNEVGSFIWQVCDGRRLDEIVAAVVEEFDVEASAARADVEAFTKELVEKRMLRVE